MSCRFTVYNLKVKRSRLTYREKSIAVHIPPKLPEMILSPNDKLIVRPHVGSDNIL
jgi:hypothetical protein